MLNFTYCIHTNTSTWCVTTRWTLRWSMCAILSTLCHTEYTTAVSTLWQCGQQLQANNVTLCHTAMTSVHTVSVNTVWISSNTSTVWHTLCHSLTLSVTHTSTPHCRWAGTPPAERGSWVQPAPRPVWCLELPPPLESSTPAGSGSPTPPTDIRRGGGARYAGNPTVRHSLHLLIILLYALSHIEHTASSDTACFSSVHAS